MKSKSAPYPLLMSDLPADDRPRERLERIGPAALSTPELIAILLRTGVQGNSATAVATRLLDRYGGMLDRLARAPLGEICAQKGIGHAKAVALASAFELGRRLRQETLPQKVSVSSPAMVAEYLRTRMRFQEQEEFRVLFLNIRNQIVADECVTVGLMDRSLVHCREVFRNAIRIGCMRIIIAHNHPSGDPRPSEEDKRMTEMLVAAGNLLDVRVLDHIVVGRQDADPTGKGFFSFGEAGLL